MATRWRLLAYKTIRSFHSAGLQNQTRSMWLGCFRILRSYAWNGYVTVCGLIFYEFHSCHLKIQIQNLHTIIHKLKPETRLPYLILNNLDPSMHISFLLLSIAMADWLAVMASSGPQSQRRLFSGPLDIKSLCKIDSRSQIASLFTITISY